MTKLPSLLTIPTSDPTKNYQIGSMEVGSRLWHPHELDCREREDLDAMIELSGAAKEPGV
jgi:hypothetical protein